MEVLMEYHLVLMAMAFVLLLFTVILMFIVKTKEAVFAGIILSAINWLLCLICMYGFFRIGLIGYTPSGTTPINVYTDLTSIHTVFYGLHFLSIAFIYYGYWLWVKNPWKIGETGSTDIPEQWHTKYKNI